MLLDRSSGILLHPTSLPGRYGIGDLGPQAFAWVDWLSAAGQRLWQILPLGPTGYGDSPYQCFSAFAGNPYLISPDLLLEEGLLEPEDLASIPAFPTGRVDFGSAIHWKLELLARAFERFRLDGAYEQFCAENAFWLDDFALFMALKDSHDGAVWSTWDRALVARKTDALARARTDHARAVDEHKFRQFQFYRQWSRLKAHANERGVRIIGDVPIFVAYDSADVWANQDLFFLDATGRLTVVAGVPPDYFSKTGQRWGNPLYRWDVLKAGGYQWWIERLRTALEHVDLIRIDHFRGFEAYWEIPASLPTAEKGKWVEGPGPGFFEALQTALGADAAEPGPRLPIIAEDLGIITDGVVALRDRWGFPGMKILQFAFSTDAADAYLPHNYSRNCVVYPGTHDNDTSRGWYASASQAERAFCRRYLGRVEDDIAWDFIRLAWSSIAVFALATIQDVLSLGAEARMNLPGRESGNWGWRFAQGQLGDDHYRRLADLTNLYGRDATAVADETRRRPGH